MKIGNDEVKKTDYEKNKQKKKEESFAGEVKKTKVQGNKMFLQQQRSII